MSNPVPVPGLPQQQQADGQPLNLASSAEFFLSNYRLGKTLGVGSFGKVRVGRMHAVARLRAMHASRPHRLHHGGAELA
jgi:hypothetical protein